MACSVPAGPALWPIAPSPRLLERVAILGHGRFGRALGGLIEEAGSAYRALDPNNPPPDEVRASSLPELVQGAEIIVVAVPVPAIRPALESLRPHLAPSQLVIDVGSVKVGPKEALQAVLGEDVPWAASHPLFGPASLARGERPLRVVICPNRRQEEAVARARRFYQRIGCTVMELDAEAHDRAMADTHALAFFVAKALLEIGVETHPLAPPSFQAMTRTIEAVRSDAGHLFHAIQSENEFAASARRRLIDTLENIDEHLEHAAEQAPATYAIPDLGVRAPDLLQTRDLIDELDRELIALLARRAQLSLRAGRAKAGRAVRDPEREKSLLENRLRWAAEAGLDEATVRDLFDAILRSSRRLQREKEP